MGAERKPRIVPKIFRDDITGEPPPKWLTAHLASLGGRNIYDEANFRMAFAENIRRKVGCQLPIWPKDANGKLSKDPNQVIPIKEALKLTMENVPLAEVHKHVLWQAEQNNRPLRTEEAGAKWVKKYTFTGYVIERWNPPHMYGDPATWESVRIEGYPILGPFPHEGDYELIGGSEGLSEWPAKDRITQLMEQYWQIQQKQPENPKTRMLLRIAEWKEREEAEWKALYDEFEPETREMTEVLMSRVSLAARAYRSKIMHDMPWLESLA